MTAPKLPADTAVPWNQTLFDIALDYPIASDQSRLALDPKFGRFGIRVVTVLRFSSPGHPERVFEFRGDPGLVRLDPRWHQAALRFVRLGFDHILDGIDHLLFLFCLVIPIRRITQLVIVVTAFTVAHSITLFAAAFGFAPGALWFPPLIETLIAVSIVYMGLENIVFAAAGSWRPQACVPRSRRRWMIAFAFGLVHGFGFSFALQETLQFAGSHVVTSLFSFNVGVELGQLLVLMLLVPLLTLLFRYVLPEKIGIIILSALVVHTAWHWMIERGSTLGKYDWSISAVEAARGVRWITVAVGVVAAIWLMSTVKKSRTKTRIAMKPRRSKPFFLEDPTRCASRKSFPRKRSCSSSWLHGDLLLNRFLMPRFSVLIAACALAGSALYAQQKPFTPTEYQAGKDVVWVPTSPELVEKMLDMAKVTPQDFVMDLGSGDGRNIIAAAKRGARAIGVEYNPDMVELSRRLAREAGVADKATFVQGDMYEADISKATVMALFLLPTNLDKLQDKFLALKPGTRIVLNTFGVTGWEPDVTERLEDCLELVHRDALHRAGRGSPGDG